MIRGDENGPDPRMHRIHTINMGAGASVLGEPTDIKASPQKTAGGSRGQACSHTDCIVYELGWCDEAGTHADGKGSASFVRRQTVPRRRNVIYSAEWRDYIPIICNGCAAYSIVGDDGRRQVLSFRLPGDLISPSLTWNPKSNRSVVAITPVIYREFERKKFTKALSSSASMRDKLFDFMSGEIARSERLMYTIGRHRADERVARLLVRLSERLSERDMLQGQVMEFPLRHKDIADILGLTQDHVSRILRDFQRANLIKIDHHVLAITNEAELRSRALRFF